MTNYYARTIASLTDFVTALKKLGLTGTPKTHIDNLDDWVIAVTTEVDPKNGKASINTLIKELLDQKKDLKAKTAGLRARRLGLQSAGISPLGPYGLAANGSHAAYEAKAKGLGDRIVKVLAAIKGQSLTPNGPARVTPAELLAALEFLLPLFFSQIGAGTLAVLQQLVGDLASHEQFSLSSQRKFLDADPLDSSYWPSSFIASSSSSTSLPPPPPPSSSMALSPKLGLNDANRGNSLEDADPLDSSNWPSSSGGTSSSSSTSTPPPPPSSSSSSTPP